MSFQLQNLGMNYPPQNYGPPPQQQKEMKLCRRSLMLAGGVAGAVIGYRAPISCTKGLLGKTLSSLVNVENSKMLKSLRIPTAIGLALPLMAIGYFTGKLLDKIIIGIKNKCESHEQTKKNLELLSRLPDISI